MFSDMVINGVKQSFIQLKADKFSETMFECADEWDAAVTGDTKIQAEKAKLLIVHGKGHTIGGRAIVFE